ncbi:MAG TPA: hypothetical protein VHC49_24065 [Mycobacteriales bacterium]|nr:hypothetical protein [Mycobacteriales bacterium]
MVEVILSGSPRQYLEFARALRIGSGTAEFPGSGGDVHRVTVRSNDAESVLLSYTDHVLLVEGPMPFLRILAGTVTSAAVGRDPRHHTHIDYCPGHYYLGEGSVPLVLHDAHPPDDRPEPAEILTAAGFEFLGHADQVGGVTVPDAFALTVHLNLAPDVRVPDPIPGVEAAWRQNADEVGLMVGGTFFICIPGAKALDRPWNEVRIPSEPFLQRLHDLTGTIDFHAIAPSGNPVVALSEEEDSTWIINVDPYG